LLNGYSRYFYLTLRHLGTKDKVQKSPAFQYPHRSFALYNYKKSVLLGNQQK